MGSESTPGKKLACFSGYMAVGAALGLLFSMLLLGDVPGGATLGVAFGTAAGSLMAVAGCRTGGPAQDRRRTIDTTDGQGR